MKLSFRHFMQSITAAYLHQSPDSVGTAHAPTASSLQLLHLVQTGTLPELPTTHFNSLQLKSELKTTKNKYQP